MTLRQPPPFLIVWLAAGATALLILPWYGLEDRTSPPALFAGTPWLWPLMLPLLLGVWASLGRTRPRALIVAGAAGLVWLVAEGLLIIHRGWAYAWLAALFGNGPMQPAMGWGAALYALACLMLLAYGLARLGVCKGDVFVVGAILLVVGLIALFVFYPVLCILSSAVRDNDGGFAPTLFAEKLFSASIWSIDCVTGARACGVAWNTVAEATLVGGLTTLLGLTFALVALRTRMPLISRTPQLRVLGDDELRDPRHGDRRVVHPGIQRAAGVAHRHWNDHRDRLRVPQHAGWHPRRARQPEPDRSQPG
jgi:iron(III) transport system permease protein